MDQESQRSRALAEIDEKEKREVADAETALRDRETQLEEEHRLEKNALQRERTAGLDDLSRTLIGLPDQLADAVARLQDDIVSRGRALDHKLSAELGDAREEHDREVSRAHENARMKRAAVREQYPD